MKQSTALMFISPLLLGISVLQAGSAWAQSPELRLPSGEKIGLDARALPPGSFAVDDPELQKTYVGRNEALEEATAPVVDLASESIDIPCQDLSVDPNAHCGKLQIRPFKVSRRTALPLASLINIRINIRDLESSNFRISCPDLGEDLSLAILRDQPPLLNCNVLYKKKPHLSWNLMTEIKNLLDDELRSGTLLTVQMNADLDALLIKRHPNQNLDLRFNLGGIGNAETWNSLVEVQKRLIEESIRTNLRELEGQGQWALLLPGLAQENFLDPCRSAQNVRADARLKQFCSYVLQAKKDGTFRGSALEDHFLSLRKKLVKGFWDSALKQDSDRCESGELVALNVGLSDFQIEIDEGTWMTLGGDRYVTAGPRKAIQIDLVKNIF
jgi:hypothetical protein